MERFLRAAYNARTPPPDDPPPTHIRWMPHPWAVVLFLAVVVCIGVGAGLAQHSEESAHAKTPSATASTRSPRNDLGPDISSRNGKVLVHVIGAVKKPGLVTLASHSRINDAINAAGGPSDNADISALNLAKIVQDAEQIRVPTVGESASEQGIDPGNGEAEQANGGNGISGGKININTASLSTLQELPGIGPALAQRIVDYRTQNGRFGSVDQLTEVSGIGEKVVEKLRPQATV